MISYHAYLLSYKKYAENDVILNCYSKEQGFVSFFVNAGFSSKNKLRAFYYPFNLLHIQILPKNLRSELKTYKSLELVNNDLQLQNELKNHSLCFLLADFLNQILSKEIHHELFFSEIEYLINEIKSNNSSAFLIFLMRILFHLGYCPECSDAKYLDIQKGIFDEVESVSSLNIQLSYYWKTCIFSDFDYKTQIPKPDRKDYLESIFMYYQTHYPNFKTPKSYEVLKDILS